MSNDLLNKVVDTTLVNDGNTAGQGGLTYAQAESFIDYMWDSTSLGSLVTKRRMRAVEEEWDVVSIGARLTRGATEAVDTGVNEVPGFSKVSITVKKFRLDWEISTESLEDNIEGGAFEQHLAQMMATQLGNDLEDYAINGDTGSAVEGVKVMDGWRKRAVAGGHVVDHAGEVLNRAAFNKALKAMPRKFMTDRRGLRFLTGSNAIQDWLYSFQEVETGMINPEADASRRLEEAVRTEGGAGFTAGRPFGVPLLEVPLFLEDRDGDYDTDSGTSGVQLPASNIDHTDLWLVNPKNLIWGVKREVVVHREFKPKKDTTEFTVFVRQGVQIQNLDAFVVVKNVRIAD